MVVKLKNGGIVGMNKCPKCGSTNVRVLPEIGLCYECGSTFYSKDWIFRWING